MRLSAPYRTFALWSGITLVACAAPYDASRCRLQPCESALPSSRTPPLALDSSAQRPVHASEVPPFPYATAKWDLQENWPPSTVGTVSWCGADPVRGTIGQCESAVPEIASPYGEVRALHYCWDEDGGIMERGYFLHAPGRGVGYTYYRSGALLSFYRWTQQGTARHYFDGEGNLLGYRVDRPLVAFWGGEPVSREEFFKRTKDLYRVEWARDATSEM